MRKVLLFCLAPLLLAAAVFAVSQPLSKNSLPRRPSVTVVKGGELYGVLGVDIAKLRLFAVGDAGRAVAIPYQIDQCDDGGNYVLPNAMGGDSSHLKREIIRTDFDGTDFDEHDELVFITSDAGHRAPASEAFDGADKVLEIELEAGQKQKGWVYLAAYEGTPPTPSKKDYVIYNPQAESVATSNYTARYRPGKTDPFVSGLKLTAGDGIEILDRIKIRMHLQSKVLLSIDVNEDDIRGSQAGYIDGPVRVIRSGEYDLTIGKLFEIHLELDSVFAPDHIAMPAKVVLPLNIATVAKQAWISGGIDLTSAAAGMDFYPSKPTPVKIDGQMSPEETAVNGKTPAWVAWSGHGATMMLLGDVPARFKTTPTLRYLDDAQADVGPDTEPGAWGQGSIQYDIMNLQRGVMDLSYHLFVFKGTYRNGREGLARAAIFSPLKITVNELPG